MYDEEGLTLLPGGKGLDVDAYVFQFVQNGMNTSFTIPTPEPGPARGTRRRNWGFGYARVTLFEEGPEILMANGTVYTTGANAAVQPHRGPT